MMRSGNPVLKLDTFSGTVVSGDDSQRMTIAGTVNKTALLLALLLITATWAWFEAMGVTKGEPSIVMPLALGGAVVSLVIAITLAFKQTWAPVLAPAYALAQGVFVGAISAIFEARMPGIVMQAVGLTFGVLAALLMAYRSGLIQATENFKLGVAAATGGIFLLYLVNMGLRLFTDISIPFIHESGLMGIGFSLFVVVIAALNLVLDFDFIESGAEQGAPKHMEWYGAFGLMVTLVWLYLEILRLLSKLQSRD